MANVTDVGFDITANTKGVKSATKQVQSLGNAVVESQGRSMAAMRSAEKASKRFAHNTGKN